MVQLDPPEIRRIKAPYPEIEAVTAHDRAWHRRASRAASRDLEPWIAGAVTLHLGEGSPRCHRIESRYPEADPLRARGVMQRSRDILPSIPWAGSLQHRACSLASRGIIEGWPPGKATSRGIETIIPGDRDLQGRGANVSLSGSCRTLREGDGLGSGISMRSEHPHGPGTSSRSLRV